VNFSLATNRAFTGEDGEKKESTVFVEITAWARLAEAIAEYTKKGDPLFVNGRLDQDTWEDKETKKTRSKLFVVAETVQFLSNKKTPGEPSESND